MISYWGVLPGNLIFTLSLDKSQIRDKSGSVAQWITRLTTNQEIAGSIPARLELFFDYLFGD